MQALAAALELGALPGPPVLFRLPDLPLVVQGAYMAAGDLAEVRTLPWADATPARAFAPASAFARVIDMRDFAFDPAFRGVAMIDFFLARLGLDPGRVPPALRRNSWLARRVPAAPWPTLPHGYALVCPRTSMRLRDMPEAVHAAVLDALTAAGLPVLTQGAARPGVLAALPAADFAGLCGLVAGAAIMVSADTAMPHLADAFGVPCLALFTTHRPEWRVRDYPLCHSVHLPAALPAALEFSESAVDLAAAEAAWFPRGTDLTWLHRALTSFLGKVVPQPTSICIHATGTATSQRTK